MGSTVSTPMTPEQLIRQLKKWDVPFREIPGWRTHNRDEETGLFWGPVYGCLTHHTGDDAPDLADRSVIRNGRAGLPGPLAQFGLPDDGVLELIGWGRANHAGGGDPDVLNAVIKESYGDYPPHPDKHTGESGATDGNDHFYGMEIYYSGAHRMTAKQYRTMLRTWAAICDWHGWSAKSVIGHKEWSDWKVDPGYMDMKELRKDVQDLLDGKSVPDNKTPRKLPPRIVEAKKVSRDYQRALQNIKHSRAQDEVDALVKEVKRHRRWLNNYTKDHS